MIPSSCQRDDQAVSAAVATVLLFGGVVSIISIMLLSLMPVIQELEGSLKRNDMQAQMEILRHEVTLLSETGMPGDSSQVELIPVDGELNWDRLRGGMWYSASWYEGDQFRIKDALDLDRDIDVRHPDGMIQAVCFDDLRLGPDRPFIFTPNNLTNSVLVTPKHGLSIPLGPVEIKQGDKQYMLSIGEVLRLSSDEKIYSSHDLSGVQLKGDSGSILVEPTKPNPSSGKGQNWAIPISAGVTEIEVFADDGLLVQWVIGDNYGEDLVIQSASVGVANSWKKSVNLTEDSLLEIVTDADAHLLITTGDSGTSYLLGEEGNFLSKRFIAPHSLGNLSISNPSSDAVTITWKNGGISVPANQTKTVAWPPINAENSLKLESSQNVLIQWSKGEHSLSVIPSIDTGQVTGSSFMQDNSEQFVVSNSKFSDYMSMYGVNGESGSLNLEDDGADRCIAINKTASGWISTTLPWESMNGLPEGEIIASWRDGSHPASMSITLIGEKNDASHANLATAWAFHTSRLTYEFDTSVTGLEVAWSGGAIVTNHPELEPAILNGPPERQGPGPRFSATIPSMHPTQTSTTGGGAMTLDIELTMRESIVSTKVYDLRRAWVGPYGDAIAAYSSTTLETSEDWILYPGNTELLQDYVGWVPVPSYGPSEAVWHAAGEPIQFNLQISTLDVEMTEVSS